MSLIDALMFEPARLAALTPWASLAKPRGHGVLGGVRPAETVRRRYFLHVRSAAADGRRHLFQFALADDEGNVALSAFARGPSPVGGPWLEDEEGHGADALSWDELEAALRPCRSAWVVAFGKRLHGDLLPSAVRGQVARMDCARSRFLRVARRRGLAVSPGDLLDLNDARRLIGLAPVRSPDAALRALALRELWRWMDGE